MPIPGLSLDLVQLPAPLPIWHGRVDTETWRPAARAVAAAGGRLVALWGADHRRADGDDGEGGEDSEGGSLVVSAAYAVGTGLTWLELALPADAPHYPDLSEVFPAAARMQRAVADLVGVLAQGFEDRRPWVDHGTWAIAGPPLRTPAADATEATDKADAAHMAHAADATTPGTPSDYAFVRVEGDGVHEIAVGPVHAGIIEPGHFRFSVVGEKVLRLEQHLGYTHKGIEQRFTRLAPLDAHRLAGRVSGDSSVAFAWAYCMALESATGCDIPERAQWLRALMLERERVANHLGDLGALGNDAAFGFGLAQFSRLREDWQRLSMQAFGHRLMMDVVAPGGVTHDPDATTLQALRRQCDATLLEVRRLRTIYDEHAGLQDRFMGTGRVTPELAAQLGLTGLAGRASAQAADLRADHPCLPYDRLGVKMAAQRGGDVAARVAVRFDEVFESLRQIREICARMPGGPTRHDVVLSSRSARGAGWVEGWRGEVFVALELDTATGGSSAAIARCHCHDPSWQNWPVLEHAVIGNIVPDFPLINKSFNLSYSGQDL